MNAPKRSGLTRDLGFGLLAITWSLLRRSSPKSPRIRISYAGLVKPPFNPPNWMFGPILTMLYLMMAIAVWRILRLP